MEAGAASKCRWRTRGRCGPRYAIGADGAWSAVRKALALGRPGTRRLAGGASVLPRRGPGRQSALGLVRGRHGAGLRVVVPVAGWHRQCRLRRVAPSRVNPRVGSGASALSAGPAHIARGPGRTRHGSGSGRPHPFRPGNARAALTGPAVVSSSWATRARRLRSHDRGEASAWRPPNWPCPGRRRSRAVATGRGGGPLIGGRCRWGMALDDRSLLISPGSWRGPSTAQNGAAARRGPQRVVPPAVRPLDVRGLPEGGPDHAAAISTGACSQPGALRD